MGEPMPHARAGRHALTRLFLLSALLPLQLVPAAVRADEGEAAHAVEVNVVGAAIKGHGWPQLVVTLTESVLSLNVDLQRSDGEAVHLSAGRLGRGTRKIFELKQPDGGFHYDGKLTARFPRGDVQTLPVSFEAAVSTPPRITVGDQAVNLAARTVTLSADRELADVQATIHSDDGQVIDTVALKPTDTKAGDPFTLTWIQGDGVTVLWVELRVTDKYGFFQELDLFPWKIEIPHEDVLFDSGKSDILPPQQPKLDAALGELAKAVEKYGRYAKVALFVAGYTDTVGDAASNKTLSEARALAISKYFRGHGVRIPISYTGFGEEQLLVATPDETAEARNRRAAYTVAIEAPRGAHWTKLP